MNLEYFTIWIRLAQLSFLVAKKLSSAQAFRQGTATLVKSVIELDEGLKALHLSIEPKLQLRGPLDFKRIPAGMTLQQTLHLKYFYLNMVLDIHTALTFPWNKSFLESTPYPALQNQLQKSIHMVAETCQDSILTTQHLSFHASTPIS